MEEIWKDIEGYEGLYQVSNLGRIVNSKGKIKSPHYNNNGYCLITLYKNDVPKYTTVHRIVAETFISNPNNLPQVNHKDENKNNNCVTNLEWCDRKYNANYGNRNRKMGDRHKKPILQYSIDGILIKEWDCAKNAALELGINAGNIGRCCMGKQETYKGYKWKYAA